ncbi:unnamed protein product [Miscanthus lutarioriparius]|uniref:Uncharacterized protein n=1 Tax=Miscanthus lutarioriparius TaxID=422564 RepID=A0A811QJD4_9POAL|nr:unnamed protein product [Miscanthus lutarioriparius]
MERCSAKDLEKMKAADAIAAKEEMKATYFVVAYKRLPKREIEFILAHAPPPKRIWTVRPPSTSRQRRASPGSRTRCAASTKATGFFKVDDDYIADRVKKEKMIHEAWSTMFDDSDLQELVFGYQSDSDDLEDDMNDVNSSATDT